MQQKTTDDKPCELVLSAADLLTLLNSNTLAQRIPTDQPYALTIRRCNDQQLDTIIAALIRQQWHLQLVSLYISYNPLTALPDSLGQLSALRLLDCGDNQLTALPDSLGQLSALQTLRCHNNQLTALPIYAPSWREPLLEPLVYHYRELFNSLQEERQRFHEICVMLCQMKLGIVTKSISGKLFSYLWQPIQLVQNVIYGKTNEPISAKLFFVVTLNPNLLRIILSYVTPEPRREAGFRQLTHPSNGAAFIRFFNDITHRATPESDKGHDAEQAKNAHQSLPPT